VEAQIEVEPVGDLVLKGFQRPVPANNILGISRAGPGPIDLPVQAPTKY
jgi:hypothetical protein